MKKILLSTFFAILAIIPLNAAKGWYSDYVLINSNGVGEVYYWIGIDPSFGTQLNGTDFGTVSSLVITGCDMKYWANDGEDRTGGAFYYKIMASDNTTEVKASVEYIWNHASIGGSDYQGTLSGLSVDLFNGLKANTTYKLHIWAKSWGTGGDDFLSNNGANYVATFTTPAYHFRSSATGNWNSTSIWSSSADGSTGWAATSLIPSISATSVSIEKDYEITVSENATSSGLTVQPGARLSISSGKTLSVTGNLNLKSDGTNGTATLLNSGTLTVNGTANVEQYLADSRNYYLSSPITSATLPTSGFTYYTHSESSSAWSSALTELTGLNVMQGFIAKPTTAPATITFSGASLNNDEKTIALTRAGTSYQGYNLVGNPYPAHLGWTAEAATAANTLPTIWYRTATHNGTKYIFSFQTYNAEGVVGAPISASGWIPPMQGFWVRVNEGAGTLTLNSTMTQHRSSNPLKVPSSTERKLLRLTISNQNTSDETVIYSNDKAVNEFDSFDSPKMFIGSSSVPELYTRAGSEKLVINGLSAIEQGMEMPIGFISGETNSYEIRINELTGFDSDIAIVLQDKLLHVEFDLTKGDMYQFTSDATNSEDRFVIQFKSNSGTTGLNDSNHSLLSVYSVDDRIMLQGLNWNESSRLAVFNAVGQLLHTDNVLSESINYSFHSGVYFVRVNHNGMTTTSKVIVK